MSFRGDVYEQEIVLVSCASIELGGLTIRSPEPVEIEVEGLSDITTDDEPDGVRILMILEQGD